MYEPPPPPVTPPPPPDVPPPPQAMPAFDPPTTPVAMIRTHDPLAAALGNASLLGVGYFLLRRPVLGLLTTLVTIVLVVLNTASFRSVGFEFVVVAWWLVLVAHGWFLARRRSRKVTSRKKRIVAVAFAVPVLLIFTLLRIDAESIDGDITDARAAGDCPAALSAVDSVWLGDVVADAPLPVRGDQTTEACGRLSSAESELREGLRTGSPYDLQSGFDQLGSVLADLPGHEHMVDTVLNGFLHGIPTGDPCRTVNVTNWLAKRPATHDLLDRSTAIIPTTAPSALVQCGDQLLRATSWSEARDSYQQLLTQYPNDPQAPKAKAGVNKATLAIDLDTIRTRVDDGSYCSDPAKYGGAPAYHKGSNRVLFQGQASYANQLPGSWRTTDPAKAAIIACLGAIDNGPAVRTCTYTSDRDGVVGNVTFHKIAIPVKAYAVRTGKLVVDATIQISGSACPQQFFSDDFGIGPPPDQYVDPSAGNVQAAFKFLVIR